MTDEELLARVKQVIADHESVEHIGECVAHQEGQLCCIDKLTDF